jgi:hypothetical protein
MYEEVLEQLNSCKQKILDISDSVVEYIEAHDKYFFTNEKDATLLKEKMKEKVARVLNET